MFYQKMLHLLKVVLTYKNSFSSVGMHNTLHRYSFKRKILKLCLQREKKNRLLCLLMFAFFCILLMEENISILFISKLLLLGFRQKKKSRHLIKILKPRLYFFSYNSKVQVFLFRAKIHFSITVLL